MEGKNVTSGDYTLNPAAIMDTLTFNVAANGDSIMFDVTILDDMLQEGAESITFSIASTSSGLTTGTISTHVFTIDDNDTPIPTYTIDQIDGLDANFELDSAGVECKIIATVLGVQKEAKRKTQGQEIGSCLICQERCDHGLKHVKLLDWRS